MQSELQPAAPLTVCVATLIFSKPQVKCFYTGRLDIKSNFTLKQSIHPSLCVLSVMEALYRLGLLWTQVKLQDDFSGDGVALLRRLEGRKTEGDLGLLFRVLHQPN